MQITITDLCKYAGVSRGTFYTHFGNIGQVVEEVFSDALYDIKNMALLSENGSSSNIIVRKGLCWLLRENPKYQPLFFSLALFLPAVKHTVVALKQDFLDVMLDKTSLDESTLTDLLTVQIMGCLEMCRKHLGKSDEEIAATSELVLAITVAERERPSIAVNSPNISPTGKSQRITSLPDIE